MIQAEIQEQADILQSYLPIMNIPSNPLDIISWAEKLVLGLVLPQLRAYINYALQLVQTLAALQQLEQAISSAEKNVIACSISIDQSTLVQVTVSVNSQLSVALTNVGSFQAQINGLTAKVNPNAAQLTIDTSGPDAFVASVAANSGNLSFSGIISS